VAFNRRWKQLFLRNEISLSQTIDWARVEKRRLGDVDLREMFARAFRSTEALNFIVGIEKDTWSSLESARRQFGNAEDFCLLRAVRLAMDRFETVEEAARASLIVEAGPKTMLRRTKFVLRMHESDSRAADHITTVKFATPRQDHVFGALSLLVQMSGMGTLGMDDDPESLALRLPEGSVLEFWDAAFAERHWAAVEWSMETL
jgi:hypothetical protein